MTPEERRAALADVCTCGNAEATRRGDDDVLHPEWCETAEWLAKGHPWPE